MKEKPRLAAKVHTLFKVLNLQEGKTPNPDDKFKVILKKFIIRNKLVIMQTGFKNHLENVFILLLM